MTRILVTGAAGFIGSHIVDAAIAEGGEVRAFDALSGDAHPAGAPALPVPILSGDVCDLSAVRAALAGVDVVCHQAAMVGLGVDISDAPAYVRHNLMGTATLLAAMAETDVRRLVLASSMVVYGEGAYRCAQHGPVAPRPRVVADLKRGEFEPPCPVCGGPLEPTLVTEDAPLDPRNVYATTKVGQEHLASSWARAIGGRVAALRYHNVYGPRMPRDTPYAGVASIIRSALERNEAPLVFEDGGQRRDFAHVTDIAAANLAALRWTSSTTEGAFRSFNVGSGVPCTVGEMATIMARAYGGKEPVVTGTYRLGDVRHITASSRRAQDELGYDAAVRPRDGLRDFVHAPLRDVSAS